jgi:hypothetical protein
VNYQAEKENPKFQSSIDMSFRTTAAGPDPKEQLVNDQMKNRTFWRRVGREIEPIIRHMITTMILLVSILGVGACVVGLERMFPHLKEPISWIERVDIWICLMLLAQFGLYTLLYVGVRLWQSLKEAAEDR